MSDMTDAQRKGETTMKLTYVNGKYEAVTGDYQVSIDEQTMQDTLANYQGDEEDCYTAEFWVESYEDDRLDESKMLVVKR